MPLSFISLKHFRIIFFYITNIYETQYDYFARVFIVPKYACTVSLCFFSLYAGMITYPGYLSVFCPVYAVNGFNPLNRNKWVMTVRLTVRPAVSQGFVRRRCGSGGLWEREDNGQVWRDMTQCEEEKEVTSQEVRRPRGLQLGG